MEESNYNIGPRHNEAEIHNSGIAYVVIPSDIERGRYISECYRTSTISIYSEYNGWNNRVPVDKFSLNLIEFPLVGEKYGSAVAFIVDPIHKKPIVIGIFNKTDEYCDLVENQFKFKRELNGNVVEIVGSPNGKYLTLNVIADKAGEIHLNVRSKDESAKVVFDVDGEIEMKALTDASFVQYNSFVSKTMNRKNPDEFSRFEQSDNTHTFNDKFHNINTEKLVINDGDEPYILGKAWASFMKDFIEEVGNSTVSTSTGQMPLLNAKQITAYKNKVDKLLSSIAFINK